MTDLQLLEGLMRGLGSCPTEALRILRSFYSTVAAAATTTASCAAQSDCSSSSSSSSNGNSTRCDTDVAGSSSRVPLNSAEAAAIADTVLHLWLLLLESRSVIN
jgi:hypothetical protein